MCAATVGVGRLRVLKLENKGKGNKRVRSETPEPTRSRATVSRLEPNWVSPDAAEKHVGCIYWLIH